jgi:hypothetical protein
METKDKSRPNVFAVGPVFDDGSTRTYYISCSCQQTMQEWMAVIDAAIQGVPEQAHRRRQTVCHKFSSSRKVKGGSETLPRQTSADLQRAESVGSSLGVEALTLSTSRTPDNDGATVDPSEYAPPIRITVVYSRKFAGPDIFSLVFPLHACNKLVTFDIFGTCIYSVCVESTMRTSVTRSYWKT